MAHADRAGVAWRLTVELARARTEAQAGAAVARAAAQLAGSESARVWVMDRTQGYRLSGAYPEGQPAPDGPPADVPRTIIFGVPAAAAAKKPFRSRLIVPLLTGMRPIGAIELIESAREEGPFEKEDAGALSGLVEAADSALEGVRQLAGRERGHIEAITRLTRLFDVGRSFAGTLDLDRLVQIVVNRVQATMEVEGAYLWFFEGAGEKISLVAAAGPASEAVSGWELAVGEGVAGKIAQTRETLQCDDQKELPGVEARPDAGAGLQITSLAAVPITTEDDDLLGVLEVVNKEDGSSFESGDLIFLREVASSTAIAIGNARRLDAERRASDLGSLLDVAQELSSSLEVQKVTYTLVHKAAAVLNYRRASVGLYRGAGFELTAVSGQTVVDTKLPDMKTLQETLAWAAGLDEGIYIVQGEDGEIDADRPETREKFKTFFESTGDRSFISVPLGDDEGGLGVFVLEAAEPYAFTEHAMEAMRLLAIQATVAIRNATLYQQIPMAKMFQPFARRKNQLLGGSRRRLLAWAGGLAVLAALLILVPVPLRVGGDARVVSERPVPVTAEVEGRIARVLVREGDAVQAGQILATIDDVDYVTGLETARTAWQVAEREVSRLRSLGMTAAAAGVAARARGLRAEIDLWDGRVAQARIRASSAGIVATPRVEQRVGSRLARGDVFCEVVDPKHQGIEVTVAEKDTGLIDAGMPVKVKISAYPTAAFKARVERVGVRATDSASGTVFLVWTSIQDAPAPLREGMTGQAKITAGTASIGRVMFRRPGRWLWRIIWGWLP